MSNYIRLPGVEGNVWIMPNGLNSIYVDASSNSGMDEGNYDVTDPTAPRFLQYRGKGYTHSANWQQVGGTWLPTDWDGKTVSTQSIDRSLGNVRRRFSAKWDDKAPKTFAKNMLLAIQAALVTWYEQPGSVMLLAKAHRDLAQTRAVKADGKVFEAQRALDAAQDEQRMAYEDLSYADGLIRQIDREAKGMPVTYPARLAEATTWDDDTTGRRA